MSTSHEFKGSERYEVLTRLGRGGMGSVYQVVDRMHNVRVALKSAGRLSDDSLLRFKREYRAVQKIRHPNVVTLGELFEHDHSWFFTMELIDGIDFFSRVRAAPSGRSAAELTVLPRASPGSRLGRQLAPASAGFSEVALRRGLVGLVSGVAALHAHGLVHRDLKPANVLVTDDGRVVLIDLGLVARVEHIALGTKTALAGTPAYMSPEQAAQEPVGPASDWYSVGVILYECLTGRLPIDDSDLNLCMRKQIEVPPAPRTLVPDVPADLDAVCMALLEIDPRRRPKVQEIYRRLHVDAQVPDQHRSASFSVRGLPDVFVGRAAELERLALALARASGGQQHSVILVGPSGVGKSALLRQFQANLAAAEDNTLVLRARCPEHETAPYKAFDGIMDELSKWLRQQPDELATPLFPDATPLIATTFPALERAASICNARSTATSPKDPQQRRLRLLTGIRELFRRIGERWRTVLILEDIQWCDQDSFHLLQELTRAPDAPPPLLIVYSRQSGLDDASEHRRLDPSAREEIVLPPLTREEGLELARRIGGTHPAAALARTANQAPGDPFLLAVSMHDSGEGGAHESTHAVLVRLLGSLPEASRTLLEVISLAGFPISRYVAADAADVPLEGLSAELRPLLVAGWVRSDGPLVSDLVEPSHHRIRSLVVDALAVERRAGLHGAIAIALEAARAEPDKIAQHHLRSGDRHKAAQYLRQAADRALAALAFDHAAGLLKALIDLHSHDPEKETDLFIAWGDALACAGRGADAAQAYLGAVQRCSGSLALDLKRRVAEQYLMSGSLDAGMKAGSEFLDGFGIRFPATPRRAFMDLAMLRARVALRGEAFKIKRLDQVSQQELARVDALWSMTKGLSDNDVIRSQVFQTRGLLSALASGEPYRISRALSLEYVNVLVQNTKREPKAAALLERAMGLARQLGSAHALGLTHACRALGLEAGACRWAEALDSAEQALGILRNECKDVTWELATSIRIAADCRMLMGQWRALRLASHDCREAEARGDLHLSWHLRVCHLSFLSLLDDQPDAATEQVNQPFEPIDRAPSPIERFKVEDASLRLLQYRGRAEEALALAASHRKGMVDALLLGTPILRLMVNEMALHNLLLAVELGHDRKTRLRQATRLAAKLERDGIPAAVPSGHLGHAAIAHAQRQPERALALLELAETGFIAHHREADTAAVRRRRGQLLGGDEGKALVTSAERWFAAQGVRNVPAMCRLLAPGFTAFDFGGSP